MLVLASASPHRLGQLKNLKLRASCHPSEIDEALVPGETPENRASRLALAKAQAVSAEHPASVVVGCDQVAHLNGQILRKPGTTEKAVTQLLKSRGNTVSFECAIALINGEEAWQGLSQVTVKFRNFSHEEAVRYVDAEQPLDAAGSFYSEALGGGLIESIHSDDPNALVGLPVIRLFDGLRALGIDWLNLVE